MPPSHHTEQATARGQSDRRRLLAKVERIATLLAQLDQQAQEELEPRWDRASAAITVMGTQARAGQGVCFDDLGDALSQALDYAADLAARTRIALGTTMTLCNAMVEILAAEDEARLASLPATQYLQ